MRGVWIRVWAVHYESKDHGVSSSFLGLSLCLPRRGDVLVLPAVGGRAAFPRFIVVHVNMSLYDSEEKNFQLHPVSVLKPENNNTLFIIDYSRVPAVGGREGVVMRRSPLRSLWSAHSLSSCDGGTAKRP